MPGEFKLGNFQILEVQLVISKWEIFKRSSSSWGFSKRECPWHTSDGWHQRYLWYSVFQTVCFHNCHGYSQLETQPSNYSTWKFPVGKSPTGKIQNALNHMLLNILMCKIDIFLICMVGLYF